MDIGGLSHRDTDVFQLAIQRFDRDVAEWIMRVGDFRSALADITEAASNLLLGILEKSIADQREFHCLHMAYRICRSQLHTIQQDRDHAHGLIDVLQRKINIYEHSHEPRAHLAPEHVTRVDSNVDDAVADDERTVCPSEYITPAVLSAFGNALGLSPSSFRLEGDAQWLPRREAKISRSTLESDPNSPGILHSPSDTLNETEEGIPSSQPEMVQNAVQVLRRMAYEKQQEIDKTKNSMDNPLHSRDIQRQEETRDSYNELAARIRFNELNPGYYDTSTCNGPRLAKIDLHNLQVTEMLKYAMQHLTFCRIEGVTETTMICGKGNHSRDGNPKLKPALLDYLSGEKEIIVKEDKHNSGRILVQLLPQEPSNAQDASSEFTEEWLMRTMRTSE